ncbi:MAG: pentapeptide repeat-containing protein [Acidimicrobiales bacterium]
MGDRSRFPSRGLRRPQTQTVALSWSAATSLGAEAGSSGAALSGPHLPGPALSRADLSGADLPGADLPGADLPGAALAASRRRLSLAESFSLDLRGGSALAEPFSGTLAFFFP